MCFIAAVSAVLTREKMIGLFLIYSLELSNRQLPLLSAPEDCSSLLQQNQAWLKQLFSGVAYLGYTKGEVVFYHLSNVLQVKTSTLL